MPVTEPLSLTATRSGSVGGEPLLVIHGFTGSAEAMAPLTERFAGYRCIAVDLPGHGHSAAPAELAPYTFDATVASLANVIRANAPAGSPVGCHLVGYSMGGRIALALAVERPELCRSLTLISATAGIEDASARAARRDADENLAQRLERVGLEQFVSEWMALPMWDSLRARITANEWSASMRQRMACDPTGLANVLRAAGTGTMTPLWDRLGGLAVPTLLLCGELDTKFVELGRRMTELLPEAVLEVVPDAGHAVHVEEPARCAEAVQRHLAAH